MKKIIPLLFLALLSIFNSQAQTAISPADELILPQYIQSGNSTPGRIQYVCRLRLTGLTPNATYRYFTGATTNASQGLTSAPGNFFGIHNTSAGVAGYVVGYTSGKSMAGVLLGNTPNENEFTSSNRYDQFISDASGNYSGWFCVVPTSNAVFAAGNDVYIYVQLNNGAGGTAIVVNYRTTSTVHVLDYGTTSGNNNQSSSLRGTSNVPAEQPLFVYDNTTGTGRPIFGTFTENDGITSNFTTWYPTVEAVNGSWGVVLPNNLPNGIRRIEARDVTNGTILGCPSLDADGVWPGGANTTNPFNSTTPLVILNSDAPLVFTASSNSPVCNLNTINLSSTSGSLYSWTGPNSFSSSSSTPSIPSATSANAGTYSVTITDANACSLQATTTVAVNSAITATVTGGATICSGNTTTVTVTFSGTGPWDFTYSDGTTPTTINGNNTNPYSIVTGTAGTYSVTAVQAGGCVGSGSGSAAVVVNPSPSNPTVTPAAPTISQYNMVTLVASGGGTYNWYSVPTGGTPLFTGATYNSPSLASTTTYYVDATSASCTSGRTSVVVTVTPNPITMTAYNYWTPNTIGTYHNFNIKFGGFSGLYAVPGTTDEFYSITDRGPNLDASNNVHAGGNPNVKLFPLPNFNPSMVHFKLQGDSMNILSVIPLKRPNNTNTSGLILPANAGGTGEIAYTDTSGALGSPDAWGIDCESITGGNNNDYWISEEYATSIWHVDSVGKVINRYTPYFGTAGAQPQDLALDTVFKYRNPNKGLEGVAFAPNGKVYAGIQNMIFFPASASSAIKSNSRLHRIEEIDPATGVTKMYGYEHDPVQTNPTYGYSINNGNRYIGDAVAVNDHQFLILEHGKSSTETYAKVYMIDINGATPITQAFYTGQSFEQLYTAANALSKGIQCVSKSLVVDIIACGYDGNLDKEEGITIINDSTIAICNDNDFGVISPSADGNIAANGIPSRVYVFHLNTHLDLCRNAYVTASSALTFCQGGSVTLNATTGSGFTYQWSLNGSPISGATSSTYAATASGNYMVSSTTATGCIANSANKTVNVLSLPTVSASSNTSICTGSNSMITASGASTYNWLPGSLSGNSQTVSPTATTSYTVTGTAANGCVNTATTTITVNPLPTVSSSSNTSICSGSSTAISASGAATYMWMPGSLNGSAQTVSPASTTTYTVSGTDVNGCMNTATTTITVNPLPTVTASSTTSSICSGSSTGLIGAGATTFNWMPGSLSGSSPTVNPTSTTTYTVTGTNGSGCTNTATTTITVNPLPTINAFSNATICIGSSVNINASGGTTYNWMPGSMSGSLQTVSPASTTTYTVTGTNGNGCSNTGTVTITVNPLPTITLTPSSSSICVGNSTTLTAGGGVSYTWMPGNLIGSSQSLSPSLSTTYTVTGMGSNGCMNTATSMITVNPLPPSATISQSGNVLTADAGYNYQWYLNGTPINGATTQSYTCTLAGNYSVELSDISSGCSTLSSSVFLDPTSITTNATSVVNAEIYPNPFSGSTQLLLDLPQQMKVSIECFDLLGNRTGIVNEQELSKGSSKIELSKEFFGNAAGIYFVRIACDNEVYVRKVNMY